MPIVQGKPLFKSQRTHLEKTVKAAREWLKKAPAPLPACPWLRAGRPQSCAATGMGGCLEAPHCMLFVRFFAAENCLLLWEIVAAVSLEDREALVQETYTIMNLYAKAKWGLAAHRQPQMLKTYSPVFGGRINDHHLMLATRYKTERS